MLPLVIMGTLSVMGGITALFLPETLWTHLPNTLEESEEFGSDFAFFSCPHKRYQSTSTSYVRTHTVCVLCTMRLKLEKCPSKYLNRPPLLLPLPLNLRREEPLELKSLSSIYTELIFSNSLKDFPQKM